MSGYTPLSGGCQCGAVRYRITAAPTDPHLCHCRMCQKQFGGYFAALASVPRENFVLKRGALSHFQSSADIRRGFCKDCGTPVTYEPVLKDSITFALPTLDMPDTIAPVIQYGIEAVSQHFSTLPTLPAHPTGEDAAGNNYPEWRDAIAKSARQHPDHDTAQWPPLKS